MHHRAQALVQLIHDHCAGPLEMDNGRDLIEMVVNAYKTPDEDISDEDPGDDYS
jgi:hypothetical protein